MTAAINAYLPAVAATTRDALDEVAAKARRPATHMMHLAQLQGVVRDLAQLSAEFATITEKWGGAVKDCRTHAAATRHNGNAALARAGKDAAQRLRSITAGLINLADAMPSCRVPAGNPPPVHLTGAVEAALYVAGNLSRPALGGMDRGTAAGILDAAAAGCESLASVMTSLAGAIEPAYHRDGQRGGASSAEAMVSLARQYRAVHGILDAVAPLVANPDAGKLGGRGGDL